jgi:D-arginine dehydrogenase
LSSPALGALAASMLLDETSPENFLRQGLDPVRFSPLRF